MAVQQNKKSKSKKRMRRAHHRLAVPALTFCPCGETALPHAVCPSCGAYRGRTYTANETPKP
ncbi:MAG: 50S ribosomal protein L32 [Desulfovibrio sp.]|nr:50S ribosomal protein L32 [Desulfovibrio sp.]